MARKVQVRSSRWLRAVGLGVVVFALGAASLPRSAWSQESDADGGPFARGRMRISGVIGSGRATTETYVVIGAGFGYFLLNGLQLGLDYDVWLFADPTLHRLSPEVRYVFYSVPHVIPYIGTFYRHTFVSGFDDLDHLGGRAGIYLEPSGSVYVGGGAVYERLLSCDPNVFVDCDSIYPELSIGVAL